MSSLKQLQQKSIRKKQVYKPILDNPYTDESHNWPYVEEQQLVAELVKTHVIEVFKHAPEALELYFGFNSVVEFLQGASYDTTAFLFVCNADAVPRVLLAQIPILARVSQCDVVLVPLPRGFISQFDACTSQEHNGMLLAVQNADFDMQFASQIHRRVGHVTQQPWLKFTESRIGVLASEMTINRKPAKGDLPSSGC
ncbi:LANO_0A04808g1_1 [Lachancea nothofagi CBS 11611]|uniref:LANO_0A04808g1_1 n=1 Tax=Lachancea nothofagi CBS 11611 TaxID=1266666 RepID=A0A1G4IQL2_9SACH|nr:LANO_0A04808g1_1 [Lachancea nothofagi CBS 11611]